MASVVAIEDDDPVALNDPTPDPSFLDDREAEADAEIEWMDDPAPSSLPTRPPAAPEELAQEEIEEQVRSTGRAVRSKTRREESGGEVGRVERPPRKKMPASVRHDETTGTAKTQRVTLSEWVRRHRNPLLLVAVLLVVFGTVAIRSWRSRRQELPRIAELGRVEGLPALDEGKFDRAYQLLSEAKRAVISLGDAYQGAAAIKQGADEAEIINQLVPESLESMLDEAARADPKEWPQTFDSLYKKRSVIIDAHVTAVPDSLGEGRYELDYRIFREGEGGPPRSLGRVDLRGFHLLDLTKPKVGDRVTFGARLGSFSFDLQTEQWLVGLEPDSGVIMTHMKALEALGWPSAADLSAEEQP